MDKLTDLEKKLLDALQKLLRQLDSFLPFSYRMKKKKKEKSDDKQLQV